MKKNTKAVMLIMGAAFLAMNLSACAVSAESPAASYENTSGAGISTTGEGKVNSVPDKAEVVFAVYSEGADAKEVKDRNTEENNRVLAFLKGEGFSEESVKTSNLGLNPVYDYSSGEGQTLSGYEMETEITVSDIDIAKLGDIIDASVDQGVNYIKSVNYFVSSFDEQYQEALKLAMADAKRKAQTLAEAGGVSLGDVTSIDEYGADTSQRYINGYTNYSAKDALMAAPGVAVDEMEVMPGQVEIEANVSVSYEIK